MWHEHKNFYFNKMVDVRQTFFLYIFQFKFDNEKTHNFK